MNQDTQSDDAPVRRYRPEKVVKLEELVNSSERADEGAVITSVEPEAVAEIGGRREGLEPTRYGDWEKKGRCIDF